MEEKLNELLNEIDEDIISYDGDNLFDEGLLDSISVVKLVYKLEAAFNIKINAKLITEENFKTKTAMLKLLGTLANNK